MSSGPQDAGFERLRHRGGAAAAATSPASDPQGRRSLFSPTAQAPALGSVTVECSGCGDVTAVTPRRLIGLAAPSVHLPLLRRRHWSWMRCPACRARTWVRLGVRL